jgi:hypothetical protein
VIRQNLGAGLAQSRAVLLQASENDLVALVHLRPAKPRHIPRATRIRPSALRGSRGNDEKKRNGKQKSGHLECPHSYQRTETKMVPQEGFEPPTSSSRSANFANPWAHAKMF